MLGEGPCVGLRPRLTSLAPRQRVCIQAYVLARAFFDIPDGLENACMRTEALVPENLVFEGRVSATNRARRVLDLLCASRLNFLLKGLILAQNERWRRG